MNFILFKMFSFNSDVHKVRNVNLMSVFRNFEMWPCYYPRLTIPYKDPLIRTLMINGNRVGYFCTDKICRTLPAFEPAAHKRVVNTLPLCYSYFITFHYYQETNLPNNCCFKLHGQVIEYYRNRYFFN